MGFISSLSPEQGMFFNSLLTLLVGCVFEFSPKRITTYLHKFLFMGGSPGDVSEEPVTQEKRKNGWRMSCDVGEATEGFENELWRR